MSATKRPATPPETGTEIPVLWQHFLAGDIAAAQCALLAVPAGHPDHRRLLAYLTMASGELLAARRLLEEIPPWRRTDLDCLHLDGIYRQLLDLGNPDEWLYYIDFLLSLGNVAAAYPLLNKPPAALADSPGLAAAWLRLRHVAGNDAGSIVQECNELIRRDSLNPELYLILGQALIELGEHASAWRALDLGRKLAAANAQLDFHAGRAAEHLGDSATALQLYLSATEFSQGNPAYALGAARLLKTAGAETDAMHCLALASEDAFRPLSGLVYALAPHAGEATPREPDLHEALGLDVPFALDAGRFLTSFCGYPGFLSFLALPATTAQGVSNRLLQLFPPLGYARAPDQRKRMAGALRIGLLLPDIPEAEAQAALAILRGWASRASATIFAFPVGCLAVASEPGLEVVPLRGVNLVPAQQMILDTALDALILADPHRAPLTYLLSLARLAPRQIALATSGYASASATLDGTCPIEALAETLLAVEDPLRLQSVSPTLPPSFLPAITVGEACRQSGGAWVEHRGEADFSIGAVREIGKAGIREATAPTLKCAAVGYARLDDVDVHHGEQAFLSPHFRGPLHEHSFLHDISRIASIPPIHGWLYSWRLLEEEVRQQFLVQTRRRICTLPRAVVLRCKAASNYFHWLFDGLPQLESILADPELDDWPLLIDQGLHPNLEAALRRLIGDRRPVLRQPFGTAIRIESAAIPGGGNRIPLSLQPGARFLPGDYVFCPQSIDFLRRGMRVSADQKPTRDLYLKRSGGYRKLVNEAEIEAEFLRRGFEAIDTSRLDLAEQIAVFSQARTIAGPTGAAFSNLLFAPEDCRIILFTHEACGHHFFSNLAGAIGQAFTAVTGFSIPGSHIEDHQRDYFLPLAFARQALVQA